MQANFIDPNMGEDKIEMRPVGRWEIKIDMPLLLYASGDKIDTKSMQT